jgi:antitoxin component YwqK of YwqJK toxin-antitoxin module
MLKKLIYLIIISFSISDVYAQKRDTAIYYFRYDGTNNAKIVSTIDSADFVRMIVPADSSDTRPTIHEYYPNGVSKLIGKAYSNGEQSLKEAEVWFVGDVIAFYPDGKRKSIVGYKDGRKNGYEYIYYPSGKLWYRIKNEYETNTYTFKSFMLDYYDNNGKIVCESGNGKWVIYDEDLKKKILEGAIVNGLQDGVWVGETGTTKEDSIKYTYRYKKGKFIGGEGFDRNGVAYPFNKESVMAECKWGAFGFIDILRRKTSGLKDANGRKVSLNDVKVCFIVEKNGDISNPEVLGEIDGVVKEKIEVALLSMNPGKWSPSKYFGIPVKTKMTVPMQYETVNGRIKRVFFGKMVVEL